MFSLVSHCFDVLISVKNSLGIIKASCEADLQRDWETPANDIQELLKVTSFQYMKHSERGPLLRFSMFLMLPLK